VYSGPIIRIAGRGRCLRHNRGKDNEFKTDGENEGTMPIGTCKICGNGPRIAINCGTCWPCYSENRRLKAETAPGIDLVCVVCAKPFDAHNSKAKYCSEKCKQDAKLLPHPPQTKLTPEPDPGLCPWKSGRIEAHVDLAPDILSPLMNPWG